MGSVGFDGEDEYQSSNDKKYMLPRMFLDGCGAFNHVSVPRKLRSAIKKRPRESIAPPLSILSKRHRVADSIGVLRKNGSKKSKLNKKLGRITKDEEEVAQTLNALAGMFSDANKATHPSSHNEPPETKSSAALETEDTENQRLQEESRKITSNFTAEGACRSLSSVHPTCQVFGDAQQPELHSNKHPTTPGASENQSETQGHRSSVLTVNTVRSVKQAISPDLVTVPRTQLRKHYHPMDDINNGSSMPASLSARGALISQTHSSCLRLPAWSENPNPASQPIAIEGSTTAAKHPRGHKSWKRCSAHVYISRLINVLQISESKEGSHEHPTPSATCEHAELQIHGGMPNQRAGIIGSFSGISHSDDIQNHTIPQMRSLQHQQLTLETPASCTSTNQCYDFLSLGNGVISRKEHCSETPKQFHAPYMQSQNGYSSNFPRHNSASAAQEAQLPRYLSSLPAGIGQQAEAQLRKGTINLQTQHNTRVASTLHVPDWRNGGNSPSLQNYAHTVFPHVLGSRHRQFSTPQQQFTSINSLSSSMPPLNVKIRHQHQLPLQLEGNGAALYHENIQQLQLPYYNQLPN